MALDEGQGAKDGLRVAVLRERGRGGGVSGGRSEDQGTLTSSAADQKERERGGESVSWGEAVYDGREERERALCPLLFPLRPHVWLL